MKRFSGLKLNIAVTVILLLLASLALGNFVTVMFWKKSLVISEIKQALSLTSVMGLMVREKLSGNQRISSKDLEKYIQNRDSIVSAVFFDGKTMIYPPEVPEKEKMKQVVRNAGILEEEIVKVDGNVWGLFSTREATLLTAQPLAGKNFKNHAICLQVTLQPIYQVIKQDLKTVFVYLFVNAIILFVIGWYRFTSMMVRPIERMVAASESYKISDGLSFSDDSSSSELGQLSIALNAMLLKIELDREKLNNAVKSLEEVNKELVETQKDMILAEKLASVGRLAAGLAHEIGNPLGIIQGYVELLGQSDVSQDDKKVYVGRASKELDRINSLIRQLLDFAKTSKMKRENSQIIPIFTELKEMLQIHKKDVVFEITSTVENDEIKCDQDGLRQVFLNCLLNALDAIETCGDSRSGLISVSISENSIKDNKVMIIQIEDNGIGVREENSFEYFEPFYTTKEPGKGTGLGLSVSHTIIEAHNGSIEIEGKSGEGAIVTIQIPFVNDREDDRK